MWSEEKINSFWNPTNTITNDSTTNDEDNDNSSNIIIIIKIVIVLIVLISLKMEKVEHIFILNLLVNLITISMLLRRNNNTNAS